MIVLHKMSCRVRFISSYCCRNNQSQITQFIHITIQFIVCKFLQYQSDLLFSVGFDWNVIDFESIFFVIIWESKVIILWLQCCKFIVIFYKNNMSEHMLLAGYKKIPLRLLYTSFNNIIVLNKFDIIKLG